MTSTLDGEDIWRCRLRADEAARCDDRELGPPKCFGAQRCLTNLDSGVVATGREDFWKGGSEPMPLTHRIESLNVGTTALSGNVLRPSIRGRVGVSPRFLDSYETGR